MIFHGEERIGSVGLIWKGDDELFVQQFYLRSDVQGQGIGTRVMEALNTVADREGLTLTLKVLKQSPASRLYERVGFEPCGEDEHQDHFRRLPGRRAVRSR